VYDRTPIGLPMILTYNGITFPYQTTNDVEQTI
jgi:hypothetical protein